MNEKTELLKTLITYRENYAMGYDADYHINQLIMALEEEIEQDE